MDSASPCRLIRQGRPGDLDALVAMEQVGHAGDRLSRRQFRRHLGSDTARVLVAVDGADLLGNAVLLFRSGSAIARLYSLTVATTAHGRGIGAALLDAAEQEAGRRGCREMRLEVRVDNRAALALYHRQGFQDMSRLRNYYEDGGDGLRYRKKLSRDPP